MAKVVTIGWVRHIYGATEAADFGEAFGKSVEICADIVEELITVLGFNSGRRFAHFLIQSLSLEQQQTIVTKYGTAPVAKRFKQWAEQQSSRAKRRSDPRRKIFSDIRSDLNKEEHAALILETLEAAPNLAFSICTHTPDFDTLVFGTKDITVGCKKNCGTMARVHIVWPEEDDEDEEDEENDEDAEW